MAKIIDPILSLLSILGYWAIILGSFGGPGSLQNLLESKVDPMVTQYRACYLGSLKWMFKVSFCVLPNGIEAVMVLTLICLK